MSPRSILVLGLALFSLFFGAGNLILPPQLGWRAESFWWVVCLGFCLSAVVVPMFGILAHARLQGTMFDFAKKVSTPFSLVYCFLVYGIALALPSPRTAAVTHEMAIAPFIGTPPLATSLVYFGLVFVLVMNRSQLGSLIGKYLTPVILAVLLLLIGSMLFWPPEPETARSLSQPFTVGMLEGYQTFDAIGAIVGGGVILVSLGLENPGLDFSQRFRAVALSGVFVGCCLLLLYMGLMYSGSLMTSVSPEGVTRTELLSDLARFTLGPGGRIFLSVLIGLACFTTAVGVVTGSADYVRSRFGDSRRAYTLTAIAGCLMGVLFGQLPVADIIAVALPVLMFIYPLTIVLILLNALPLSWTPPRLFRLVVATTLLFSIPDFVESLRPGWITGPMVRWIPLQEQGLAWLLPAATAYIGGKFLIGRQG
ncbi:branched-chain amino acid transport system II carrier protein [Robiginitalea sp. SC105]|nr:branched-chain amino acid transport system II carrier protein [Robiginitalea sp. SC105]